jgi:hypothetical protein
MIRYVLLFSILLGTSPAKSNVEEFKFDIENNSIFIDLIALCLSTKWVGVCDLRPLGYPITLEGSNVLYGGIPSSFTIKSEIPIIQFSFNNTGNNSFFASFSSSTLTSGYVGNHRTYEKNSKFINLTPGLREITIKSTESSGVYIYPTSIVIPAGIPRHLRSTLISAGTVFLSTYTGVLRIVENNFRNEIAKSHRGHLARFIQGLKEGIELFNAKDKEGNRLHTVVNWRVQENARFVMVFGTILNQLLNDYDDVSRLKTPIEAIRVLVSEIRASYGWENGLAGNASKASSTLLAAVHLNVYELFTQKMSMTSDAKQLEPYRKLMASAKDLIAKVDASRSGDMKAQREIYTFLDAWNSREWQTELENLLNAGPDVRFQVIPKLATLIWAMESVKDFSEQDFNMPDKSKLKI